MTSLLDVFQEIKEKDLNKDQLEDYHQKLCELRGEMRLELADKTKARAMFMLNDIETSVAQRKINWQGTKEGQREIELKAYIGATSDNINALKSRLYSTY